MDTTFAIFLLLVLIACLGALIWGIKEMRHEIISLRNENNSLRDEIGEVKTLMAAVIAESGTAGAERERVISEAKKKLGLGKSSIDYIKEGELQKALECLAREVSADDIDDVIMLTGNLGGLRKSHSKNMVSESHYETQLAKIRQAATDLALKAQLPKQNSVAGAT